MTTNDATDVGDAQTRRQFFQRLGGAGTGAALGGLIAATPAAAQVPVRPIEQPVFKRVLNRRLMEAYEIRTRLARHHLRQGRGVHPLNSDEATIRTKVGNFSKGLPHNGLGEVDLDAYRALVRACNTGRPEDFDAIPQGGTRGLVNPQAALCYDMEGADSHQTTMPAAPSFRSAEAAGEMAELYWMALARDVPFADYASSPLIADACADLNGLSDFRGPRMGGAVTPATIFRGTWPGDLVGPYLSQFLLRPVPLATVLADQTNRVPIPGSDHVISYDDWLLVQNGGETRAVTMFDMHRRYLRNGRDMAEWVHRDFPQLGGLQAALILLDMNAWLKAGFPYVGRSNQAGFVTFGVVGIIDLLTRVVESAMKAAWFQKWRVHRRLRPEAFAGHLHNVIRAGADYPIHPDLLLSDGPARTFVANQTYMLPQAFPEGSPLHSAYPSGHATALGAAVTVLKAVFDESFVLSNNVQPSPDGMALLPYAGAPLTVGGELNKLASNISQGRDFAGIHYRTDAVGGNRLGEQVAIQVLHDHLRLYNEPFDGFTFTSFDGEPIHIS